MRVLLVAAVIALAAGCPPAHDLHVDAGVVDDAGTRSHGVDPTTYCESIVDFFCPFYVRCGRMAVADADACRPVFLEACNARFEPTFTSLVNAGLLELSQDGIDQCRDHLATVDCDQQVQDLDGPCGAMWVGRQPAKAPCGFDVETFTCSPGTACVLDVTFCGTCKPTIDDGADCTGTDTTCKATSECNLTTFTCQARKKPGESCGGDSHCVLGATCSNGICDPPAYSSLGQPCGLADRCPYASACVADNGGNDFCAATAELGQPCSASTACDSGFCDAAQNGGTCVALVDQGGACSLGAQCQTGACDATGHCSVVPSACFAP